MEIGLLSNENENKKKKMVFEETELRLGLPGNDDSISNKKKNKNNGGSGGEGEVVVMMKKRGFCETDEESDESDENDENTTVDLMLNLSSSKKELIKNANNGSDPSHNNKIMSSLNNQKKPILPISDPAKPPAKAQVVGWPPVRSYRKNMFAVEKSGSHGGEESGEKNGLRCVKVSMDGAPYLRKVDLKMYKTYTQLSDALGKMFSSFTIIGNCESQGMKDFMNETNYVPTYEDKDGDWMLVGDVPWEMFIESCKRLRIMKGKEAIGLAPKAMEKCKNRS